LKQPFALRRDAERSRRPPGPGPELVRDALAGRLRGDAELRKHFGGQLVGLGEQPQNQVLWLDVVMAELACLVSRGAEQIGGGSSQSERCLSRRRIGQCAESFVGGLL